MRAALEALAAAVPDWLAARFCLGDWSRRYGARISTWQRTAPGKAERDRLAVQYARDGYALVAACYEESAPPWAREIPAVQVLRTEKPSAQTPVASATAGPPLFCTRVRTAADGEIEVAGPTLARGVAGADGWLRTGDVGRLNGEGNLLVTGRKADTIVSGGENVAPTEVEAVLESIPACSRRRRSAAPTSAGARRSPPGRRAGDAKLHGEELRAHCAARLAPYKVPKEVALVEGPLPRTRSGKLLRRELR